MTIIAWDGEILAADKRFCFGSLPMTGTKIYRHNGMLLAISGNAASGEEMLHWFIHGCNIDKFPQIQRDKNDFSGLLVIDKNKNILKYEYSPHPIRLLPQKTAIGSGRDFAIAAMHLGKNAREAVEVAIKHDIYCGNGIDVLDFWGD